MVKVNPVKALQGTFEQIDAWAAYGRIQASKLPAGSGRDIMMRHAIQAQLWARQGQREVDKLDKGKG